MTNGPPRYPNRDAASLERDLELADSVDAASHAVLLGVHGAESLEVAFELQVKWVVNLDEAIQIVPKLIDGVEIPHVFLSKGEDVLAAGEAYIVSMGDESFLGAQITNQSGHYRPLASSIALAVKIFAKHGIIFEEAAQEPVPGS